MGIPFTLKVFTLKNQIPTTKIVLPKYQNSLCAISKKEVPLIYRIERKKILNMLIIKKDAKEKRSIPILFFISISGIDKFNINNK